MISSPQPALFARADALVQGGYLHGQARWSADTWLHAAVLTLTAPASGRVTIALELGGTVQEIAFVIPGFSPRLSVRRLLPINLLVSAGTIVRWKVTEFTGDGGDEAIEASLELSGGPAVYARQFVATPVLELRWVNGCEVLPLWRYDSAAHAFTPLRDAGDRAAVEIEDERQTFTIEGVDVLVVEDGAFRVTGGFRDHHAAGSPRLEFWSGDERWGVLTGDGVFMAARLADGTPTAGLGEWVFRGSAQSPVAVLKATGLTAAKLEEVAA